MKFKFEREKLKVKQIIFIEGVSGVGKSTMVRMLSEELRNKGYNVKSHLEFDYTNPIDFYATAYFTSDEYKVFCDKYISSIDSIRKNTITADDKRLVRYYNEDTPLFNEEILSELYGRELCYEPKNPIPINEYTEVYKSVWKNFSEKIDNDFDYVIFDGSLLHHPINDMMRNYGASGDTVVHHIKELLKSLGTAKRQIFYMYTDDIEKQLSKAHSDRGQGVPTQEEINFWKTRYKNDMTVLNSVNEDIKILDVSNDSWDNAREKIISYITLCTFDCKI